MYNVKGRRPQVLSLPPWVREGAHGGLIGSVHQSETLDGFLYPCPSPPPNKARLL